MGFPNMMWNAIGFFGGIALIIAACGYAIQMWRTPLSETGDVQQRLDRIEEKLDRIAQQMELTQ